MPVLTPRTAVVVLYQGDDMARLAELKRAADHAGESQAPQRGDDVAGAEERAAFDEFVAQAAQRAVEVVLHSIGSRRWRDLVMDHPPRMVDTEPDEDGNVTQVEHDDDVPFGVNTATFPRALLMYAEDLDKEPELQHLTIAAPAFADEAARAHFVDEELSDGDFEKLWLTAHALNTTPRAVPKALGQTSTENTT